MTSHRQHRMTTLPSILIIACVCSCASAFSVTNTNSGMIQIFPSSASGIRRTTTGQRLHHPSTNGIGEPASANAVHNVHRISSLSLASTINEYDTTTSSTDDEDEEEFADNPLKSAGLSFVSASSKSLGMLFYNIGGMDHKDIQALLLEAGTHLVAAGEAWHSDWDAVRDSMSYASTAFYDISNVFGSANIDESMPLGTLFDNIGKELEDISEISGCCAVGPPCSSPNLLAVEVRFARIGRCTVLLY